MLLPANEAFVSRAAALEQVRAQKQRWDRGIAGHL